MFDRSVIGTISKGQVSLSCETPLVGNLYKQYFLGHIEQSEHSVFLQGCFKASVWTEIIIVAWFGFVGAVSILVTLGTLMGLAKVWYGPFFCVGLLAIALLGVRTSQEFAESEILFISEEIQKAFSSPSLVPDKPVEPQGWMPKTTRWFARKYFKRE